MDLDLTQEVVYPLKNYCWNMKIPLNGPFWQPCWFLGLPVIVANEVNLSSNIFLKIVCRACCCHHQLVLNMNLLAVFAGLATDTNTENRTNLGVAPLSNRLVTGEGAHLVWSAGYDLEWKIPGRQKHMAK